MVGAKSSKYGNRPKSEIFEAKSKMFEAPKQNAQNRTPKLRKNKKDAQNRTPDLRNPVKINKKSSANRVKTNMFMIFGRINLRISVFREKFNEESDFEVRSSLAHQKSSKNCEKQIVGRTKLSETNFWHRKMKRWELSAARFGKMLRQSEPCLRDNGRSILWIEVSVVPRRT